MRKPTEFLQRKAEAGSGRVVHSFAPRGRRLLAWCGRNRRRLREEDGGSMVEFAISISTALMLVFVLMQLCLALYTYGMIGETAREATRWAIVRGSTCKTGTGASCTTTTSAIKTYAEGLGFPNIGGGTLTVTPTYPDSCQAAYVCRVKVTVAYTVPVHLPFVPHHAIALQSSSEMYILP